MRLRQDRVDNYMQFCSANPEIGSAMITNVVFEVLFKSISDIHLS